MYRKRIGVSQVHTKRLAPHAGQMLLITVVVLAGPVCGSALWEAAKPEPCYVTKPSLFVVNQASCDIRQYTSKLLPVLLCLLVGEGVPHYHPPQPRHRTPKDWTGGWEVSHCCHRLSVDVISFRVAGWKTLSQTLDSPMSWAVCDGVSRGHPRPGFLAEGVHWS